MTREEYELKWRKCHSSSEHVDVCEGYIKSLKAYIKELEAPKTCDGCIHKPEQGENYYDPCGDCKRFYGDHYSVGGEEE